ncbi:uncharacterized protein LOC144342279 [Saccoglossus kowalevskii]
MSTFELNIISKNRQGGNLPTSKLRDLFPASEKIRRRAFVLNSQENQRCAKIVQHMQYQERLQQVRFSRIRRHLELDAQKYEVYQKALYNCAKTQLPNHLAANKTQLPNQVAANTTLRVGHKYKRRLAPIIKRPHEDSLSSIKNNDPEKIENQVIVDYNANVIKTIDEGNVDGGESCKSGGSDIKPLNNRIGVEETKSSKYGSDEEQHIQEVSNANRLFVKCVKRKKRLDNSNTLNERTYHLRSTPKTLSNLPPYGIYEGRVYRHLSKERNEASMEIDPELRRKRQAEKLFETAKSESSTLIDRRMPTSALFKDKDKPLNERLQPAKAGLRLKPLMAKMKVMQVLLKMKTEAKEKQELYRGTDRFGRGLGLERRKKKGNTFQTKIWD